MREVRHLGGQIARSIALVYLYGSLMRHATSSRVRRRKAVHFEDQPRLNRRAAPLAQSLKVPTTDIDQRFAGSAGYG